MEVDDEDFKTPTKPVKPLSRKSEAISATPVSMTKLTLLGKVKHLAGSPPRKLGNPFEVLAPDDMDAELEETSLVSKYQHNITGPTSPNRPEVGSATK